MMLTFLVFCLAAVVVVPAALLLVGLPLLLLLGLLPWLLRLAAVALLVRALLESPLRWENMLPAGALFALSLLLGRL